MKKPRENQNNKSLANRNITLEQLNIRIADSFSCKRNLEDVIHTRITNAWQDGTIIDKTTGEIWVRRDKLASLLNTEPSIAKFIYAKAQSEYKADKIIHEDGEEKSVPCLSIVEVSAQLTKIISSPSSMRQRAYGQRSRDILTFIQDSPEIQEIITLYVERVKSKLPKLKKQRIKEFNLTADELTGEQFNIDSRQVHFSHIRGKRTCVPLALNIHNGLVVNKETHDIITKAGSQDEEGLLQICKAYNWSTSWYRPYKERFKDILSESYS